MSWEFVKIYRSILGSSVSNDVMTRHIFMDLLLLADQDGRLDMTTTAMSRMTGNPKEAIEHVIAALSQPDPESRTPDNDGRRLVPIEGQGFGWKIVNFRKYAERGTSTERSKACRARPPAQTELPLGADAAPSSRVFIPPTVEQVAAEIQRLGGKYLKIDPEYFVAHYEAVGWYRGKTKIRSWKGCLDYWTRSDRPDRFSMPRQPKGKSLSDLIKDRQDG